MAKKSLQFKAELSRHNYVTPTSYLELLGIFAELVRLKNTEISTQRNRTKTGLDKVTASVLMHTVNCYLGFTLITCLTARKVTVQYSTDQLTRMHIHHNPKRVGSLLSSKLASSQ